MKGHLGFRRPNSDGDWFALGSGWEWGWGHGSLANGWMVTWHVHVYDHEFMNSFFLFIGNVLVCS